ncbi:MAG: hypothetical protein PUA50_00310 [Eubacteriales bacterium]|nr:hypothetical protein [Eubacteriales bacterium]
MSKNYLIFPMKVMGITQTYDGKTSHYISSHGSPADYPIDIAGADTGRSAFFCPCDEMKVVKIAGDITGNNHANGAWLVSTSEVDFADGTRDFVTIKFVHMNNSDFGKNGIYVGRKYKRGELIGYEGTSHATGNHIHMSAGKGGLKGSGWTKNSKGSWVITTTHGTAKPETLFFVDPESTSIKNAKGLTFKEVPKEDDVDVKVITGPAKTKSTTAALALRSEPSTRTGTRFFYIPEGKKVSIVAEAVTETNGYTWDCVIAEYGGKDYIGYSAAEFLKI